jgi:hypothetical protein
MAVVRPLLLFPIRPVSSLELSLNQETDQIPPGHILRTLRAQRSCDLTQLGNGLGCEADSIRHCRHWTVRGDYRSHSNYTGPIRFPLESMNWHNLIFNFDAKSQRRIRLRQILALEPPGRRLPRIGPPGN